MIIYFSMLFILIGVDIYSFRKNKKVYSNKEYVLYSVMSLIAVILGIIYFKYRTLNIAEFMNRYLN